MGESIEMKHFYALMSAGVHPVAPPAGFAVTGSSPSVSPLPASLDALPPPPPPCLDASNAGPTPSTSAPPAATESEANGSRERRRVHRRATRNESRYHSEVRQEAVQQVIHFFIYIIDCLSPYIHQYSNQGN